MKVSTVDTLMELLLSILPSAGARMDSRLGKAFLDLRDLRTEWSNEKMIHFETRMHFLLIDDTPKISPEGR